MVFKFAATGIDYYHMIPDINTTPNKTGNERTNEQQTILPTYHHDHQRNHPNVLHQINK